jgi:hypothetical protein
MLGTAGISVFACVHTAEVGDWHRLIFDFLCLLHRLRLRLGNASSRCARKGYRRGVSTAGCIHYIRGNRPPRAAAHNRVRARVLSQLSHAGGVEVGERGLRRRCGCRHYTRLG